MADLYSFKREFLKRFGLIVEVQSPSVHETLPTIYLFPSAPPHKIERPHWDSESRGVNNRFSISNHLFVPY